MRNLDPAMSAALDAPYLRPARLALLTFKSSVQRVWTGVGPLLYAGETFLGVGSFGESGTVSEGVELKASGTSVKLSGIDQVFLAASLEDIWVGAPAAIWQAFLDDNGAVIGTPYLLFSGTVDVPTTEVNPEDVAISLLLESRFANLNRPQNRRYTSADQRLQYPTDSSMFFVERENDIAVNWGG